MLKTLCSQKWEWLLSTCNSNKAALKLSGAMQMAAKVVRKRRVFEGCANPLFVKWVEELRDEAVEKNAKSQYAYSKVPEWLELECKNHENAYRHLELL